MEGPRRVIVILGAGGTLGSAISHRLAGEPGTDLVLSDLSESALQQTLSGLPDGTVSGGAGSGGAGSGGTVSDGTGSGGTGSGGTVSGGTVSDGTGPGGTGSGGTVSGGTAQVETVLADVSDFAQVEAVVKRAVELHGRLDVLISNAGILSPNGRIHNLTTADWERAFHVNVLGPVNGIRAAVPVMRAQKSGSIILTASVAGLTAWSHSAPYCVTKAGVIHLAKTAAVEYARDGIRVNCVCPGTFLSSMHVGLPTEAIDSIAAKHPLGLGAAEDLVGAYSYLASDAARWTTGSAIVVDGGYAAP